MSGRSTLWMSFWNLLIDAGVSGSTWITPAADSVSSSGSIQSVTGMTFRLSGKPATRAPTSSAESPSTPDRYSCTAASFLAACQLLLVSLGFRTLTFGTSVRSCPAEVLSGQGSGKVGHRDRAPEDQAGNRL